MPYYLDINPSNQAGNQYITIPAFNITGDFTIEIDCEIYNTIGTNADGFVFSGGTTGGGFEFYRDSNTQSYRPSLWYNNTKNFVSASNIWPYVSGSTANPRKITIQRVGGVVSSNFAGTVGTDVNIASGNNILISAIGARPSGTFTLGVRLYRMRLYQGATLVRDYDPSSTSSGVTLIDTVGGQNGTFQNPPAGDAQWVFYSSGADTVSFSGIMPKLTASASINAAYVASFSGTLPKLTANAAITVVSSTATVSFSGMLPKLTASAALDVTRLVSVAGVMPKLLAAVTANVQQLPVATFSGTLPALRMSTSLIAVAPQPTGDPLAIKQALVNAQRAEENRNNEYIPPVVVVPEWWIIQQQALGLKQGEVNRARDLED